MRHLLKEFLNEEHLYCIQLNKEEYGIFKIYDSDRNKPVLNYSGYQYLLKRNTNTSNEWRWRQRKYSSTLSIRLNNNVVSRLPSMHSCEKEHASKQVINEAVERMKKKSKRINHTLTLPCDSPFRMTNQWR